MSDIGTWSHEAVSKAVIPSGEDPATPSGWNDNLDQIKTAVNSKLDKSGTVTSFPTVGADVPIGPKGTATALTNYDSYDLYLSGSFWDGAAAKYRRFLARTAVDASEYYLEIASRAEGSAETARWEFVSDGTIRPTTNDTGSIGSSAKRWGDVFVTTLDASEFGNHLIPATNITWDIGSTTGPKRVRKIWAQDVDLTGTTQAIGTVTSGVWNGTAIGVAYGGTGLASGTSGGILGFTGTTTLASSVLLTASALVLGGGAGATPTPLGSLGTTATLLHGNAAGAPTWGAVALASEVSGTLPVANGGTGLTSGTSGGVLAYTATGTIASSALLTANALVLGGGAGAAPSALGSLGTTTTLLHGNAAGAPTFAAVSLTADVSGILPTANGGTGIAYFTAAGPTVARVYTFPDAACTVLTTNAAVSVAQGGTGATDAAAAAEALGVGLTDSPTFAGLTSPTLTGGTAVGSTLTLKSTSGVGSSDAIIFQVGNNGATEGGRFSTQGNFGLGAAPKTLDVNFRGFNIGGNALFLADADTGASNNLYVLQNAYRDSGADWKYISTDEASMLALANGAFYFYTVASGTADTSISWTTALTIAATTGNATFAGTVTASSTLQLSNTFAIGDDPASYPEYGFVIAVARSIGAGSSGGGIYVGSTLTSTGDGSGNIVFGERLNCGITLAASALRGRATQLYIDGKTASIGGGATLTNHNAIYLGTPVNGSTVNVIDSASGATLTTSGVWTDNPSWSHLKEAIKPVETAEVSSMFDWVRDSFAPVRYRYKTRTEMQRVPVYEEQDILADVTIAGKRQKAKVGVKRVQVGEKDEEVTLTKHQDYMYDHFGYLLDTFPENMRQIVMSDPKGGISGKDERGLLWALVQEAAKRIQTLSDRVSVLEAA